MEDLTPLTSRNGESEWPYLDKTIIAVKSKAGECRGCIFYKSPNDDCIPHPSLPHCVFDFDEYAKYIEKPATK